jgi:hypothetical protein
LIAVLAERKDLPLPQDIRPVVFFDENGFTRYTNWETMEKLRQRAASELRAEAAE